MNPKNIGISCLKLFVVSALIIAPRYGADIQFLDQKESSNISYEQFCNLMDQHSELKAKNDESFCSEANMTHYPGLPFVKSLAQSLESHGAILQENSTGEGTSGDGLAHEGPRYFAFSFYKELDAHSACKKLRKLITCGEIHKLIEEEIQGNFFFVVNKRTNDYYYFTKVFDSSSAQISTTESILLGEFSILDSSLHAENQKILKQYNRKYGKPNHLNTRQAQFQIAAWKDKSERYLFLSHLHFLPDSMLNFQGYEEMSVDKILSGGLYAKSIAEVIQRVTDKVKKGHDEAKSAKQKLLNDSIK